MLVTSFIVIIMGQRGEVTDISEQATCKVCGLTARTKDELRDHVKSSHSDNNNSNPSNKSASSEQKIDPFP
jgi:hypothetical protein